MRLDIKSVGVALIGGRLRAVTHMEDGTKLLSKAHFPTYRPCLAYAEITGRRGNIDTGAWTIAPEAPKGENVDRVSLSYTGNIGTWKNADAAPTAPTVFKTREAAELALNDPETQKVYPTWRTVYMVATREEYEAHIMENVERGLKND